MVDRTCPPVLKWTCPVASLNANQSYGVGFVDAWDGREDKGLPGFPQDDEAGVAFCNWGRSGVR
jgi:calcium channel MID1